MEELTPNHDSRVEQLKSITGTENPFGLDSETPFRPTGIVIEHLETSEIYLCIQQRVRLQQNELPFRDRTSVAIVDINGNIVGNIALSGRDDENLEIPFRSGTFKGSSIEPGNMSFAVDGIQGDFVIHEAWDYDRNGEGAGFCAKTITVIEDLWEKGSRKRRKTRG